MVASALEQEIDALVALRQLPQGADGGGDKDLGTRNSRKGAITAKEGRTRFSFAAFECFASFAFQRFFAAKRQDADADTSALEREIDALVYQLYGLTAAAREIKIVEGVNE